MSTEKDRIDELMKKLEFLTEQQALFSQQISTLKEEVRAIYPSSQKVDIDKETHILQSEVEEVALEWPEEIDLSTLKSKLTTFEEGKTSSGVKFVKFVISEGPKLYYALLATNSNWIVQDEKGAMIARGRFKEDGKTVKVTEGVNKDFVYTLDQIGLNFLIAAGIDEKSEIKPIKKFENESSTIVTPLPKVKKSNSQIEKYIGENLIAVIAVVIILIGVVFGVKYSIDHNLISPLTRIILSYLLGVGILGIGIKLKAKFDTFSAILVSGSMGIMYFVTFAAYSFYGLFPQMAAYVLMVIFTIFTVIAAMNYNKQIIALIGLVGSYCIPFLLSNNSGNVNALFTYMTIINLGILFIALKRNWKSLYYSAFGITWLIYVAWVFGAYDKNLHFTTALLFGTLFFVLFYATFLAYKLIEKEKFSQEDILMIVANSTVYYGITYMILNDTEIGQSYLGLFTVGTGVIHFIVSVILFRSKQADRNLFYLSSGMVLTFITIAIPVQLDGSWVTLLWSFEAVLLFWIGRTKQVKIYEYLSFPVILVATFSLLHDWGSFYNFYKIITNDTKPFLNISFLTTLLYAISFGTILYINRIKEFTEGMLEVHSNRVYLLSKFLTVLLIVVVYQLFKFEFDIYWNNLYNASIIEWSSSANEWKNYRHNGDILRFQSVWTINYSLIFATILTFINSKYIKSKEFGSLSIGVNTFIIIAFLTIGLYNLSVLRESYIEQPLAKFYSYSSFNIGIRYVSYAFLIGSLFFLRKEVLNNDRSFKLKISFDLFLHTTILWVLSSELINILDLSGSNEQHKLGLSILSGFYAFFLVGLGMKVQKQYLRIAAISLFALVLLKLFFYDIAHLSTISKTIVFISLGILLLIISFMYNKFKNSINDQNS